MTVTRRVYRWLCRPDAPSQSAPVGAHRRRQLAELVDRYGVVDARPATAVDHDAARVVDGRPAITGEVLL